MLYDQPTPTALFVRSEALYNMCEVTMVLTGTGQGKLQGSLVTQIFAFVSAHSALTTFSRKIGPHFNVLQENCLNI